MTMYLWHPGKTAGSAIWGNLERVNKLVGEKYYDLGGRYENLYREDEAHKKWAEWVSEESSWIKHIPVQRTDLRSDVRSLLPVRNPYSRAMSIWSYYIKQRNKYNNATLTLRKGQTLSPKLNFSKYLKDKIVNQKAWMPWRPCAYWRHHLTGSVRLIRHEHLEQDFFDVTGFEWEDYEFDNVTVGWTPEMALEEMNSSDIELINQYYHEDFEMFGYKKV
jgi:hypothetical protein